MKIDQCILTSLFTWGQSFQTLGRVIVLEFSQDDAGNTVCRVYGDNQEHFPALLAETTIALGSKESN